PLQIVEYVGDSNNFNVVSTIIYGPTEAVLVDAQNSMADGRRVAERIAATGRRLTAIIVTHPDHDHYTGAAAIVQRFPGTPLYMSPAGIEEFTRTGPPNLARMKARGMPDLPDSFVTPQPFPAGEITVDGQAIQITPDQQGDVERPTNSYLWIPSSRTLIAGDIVFSGINLWLGAATPATRTAWRAALDRLASLNAARV